MNGYTTQMVSPINLGIQATFKTSTVCTYALFAHMHKDNNEKEAMILRVLEGGKWGNYILIK